ncbi:MAG: phosphate/phosphite/phosphonate ABC transporter substrate-binding protein [Bacteroidota bacterium]
MLSRSSPAEISAEHSTTNLHTIIEPVALLKEEIVMKRSALLILLSAVVCEVISVAGCDKPAQQNNPPLPQYGSVPERSAEHIEYIFAIHPLHNSHRYFEVFQPMIDYINRTTDEFTLRLESSKDYAHFEEKLQKEMFHFALPNPYQSVQAINFGYTIFGKMGDDDQFRGIIVVRKDGAVNSIGDLRGKAISFPSATALAAAMMPKYFLKTKGLDVEKESDCRYVGSQESSIMNVYLGTTAAGCTWPPPWELFMQDHPEVKNAVTIRWQTEPLINNGLVCRRDVPLRHQKIVAEILFSLHTNPEGKTILERMNLSRFEAITQQEYVNRVTVFLDKYEHAFGSLPGIGGKK